MKTSSAKNLLGLNQRGGLPITGPQAVVMVSILLILVYGWVYAQGNFQKHRQAAKFTACLDSLEGVQSAIEMTSYVSGTGVGQPYAKASNADELCKNMTNKSPCTVSDIETLVRTNCYGKAGAAWSFAADVVFPASFDSYTITGQAKDLNKCQITVTTAKTIPKSYDGNGTDDDPGCPPH